MGWNLGPDMMKNLQTTLVRFRRNLEGAQGDIAIMFYQVRVCKQDQMMHFKGEKKVRTFCMNRLVMGNKPSTNISIIAVQKWTELSDICVRLPEVLMKDIYVDNIFVTGPDKQSLNS